MKWLCNVHVVFVFVSIAYRFPGRQATRDYYGEDAQGGSEAAAILQFIGTALISWLTSLRGISRQVYNCSTFPGSSSFSFAGAGAGSKSPCGCWPPWLMFRLLQDTQSRASQWDSSWWVSLSPGLQPVLVPLFTSTLPPNCLLQGHKAPALEAKTAALQGAY